MRKPQRQQLGLTVAVWSMSMLMLLNASRHRVKAESTTGPTVPNPSYAAAANPPYSPNSQP